MSCLFNDKHVYKKKLTCVSHCFSVFHWYNTKENGRFSQEFKSKALHWPAATRKRTQNRSPRH